MSSGGHGRFANAVLGAQDLTVRIRQGLERARKLRGSETAHVVDTFKFLPSWALRKPHVNVVRVEYRKRP